MYIFRGRKEGEREGSSEGDKDTEKERSEEKREKEKKEHTISIELIDPQNWQLHCVLNELGGMDGWMDGKAGKMDVLVY
jgi:hypothetical protein